MEIAFFCSIIKALTFSLLVEDFTITSSKATPSSADINWFMVIVSPGEIMKVFSIFLYPKKLKTMVWFPGSKDKVYNPSKSVVVPMVVPFN